MQIETTDMPEWASYMIGENCHLYAVEMFNRLEDAEEGTRTMVRGRFITQDGDMTRNKSSRRTSVVLHFISEEREEPDDKFVMVVFQHKGSEFIQFKSLADYMRGKS